MKSPVNQTKSRRHGEGTVKEWPQSKGPETRYRASILIKLPDGGNRRVYGYGRTAQAALRARKEKVAQAIASHQPGSDLDRKSTRLNSSHVAISYAVFCLKKKNDIEYI